MTIRRAYKCHALVALALPTFQTEPLQRRFVVETFRGGISIVTLNKSGNYKALFTNLLQLQ